MKTPQQKIEKRVTSLEEVNTAADEKALDDKTISLKEVYERVIALETKMDIMYDNNKETEKKFVNYVLLIIVLEIVNIFVHAFIGLLK